MLCLFTINVEVLEKIKSENKPIKPLNVITTEPQWWKSQGTWVKTSLDLLRDKVKKKDYLYFLNCLHLILKRRFG